MLAVAAGAGIMLSPVLTLVASTAVALAVVTAARPLWTAHAALFLAATTLPASIPYSVQAGGTSIFLYEPFLYPAAAFVVWKRPFGPATLRCVVILVLLVGTAAAHGVLAGISPTLVLREARGLVVVGAALVAAAGLIGTEHTRGLLRTTRASLWISAVVTALGSVTNLPLNGRSDIASLFVNGSQQATGALRLLTAATQFALATVCVCLALLITRRVAARQLLPYLLPALLITFLGFSRNALLAVTVAIIVTAIIDRSARALVGMVRIAATSVVFAVAVLALGAAGVPGADWASLQGQAFHDRVIAGLDAEVLRVDSSALAREVENRYATAAIEASPLTGHGFGYAYRPGFGEPGSFTAETGRYYVHDFYLWLLVKTGIVGLLLWLLLLVPLIVRQVLRPHAVGAAFAAAAAGLSAVAFVAPLPLDIESSGAVTIGIVLGVLVAQATVRSPSTNEPECAGQPVPG